MKKKKKIACSVNFNNYLSKQNFRCTEKTNITSNLNFQGQIYTLHAETCIGQHAKMLSFYLKMEIQQKK